MPEYYVILVPVDEGELYFEVPRARSLMRRVYSR